MAKYLSYFSYDMNEELAFRYKDEGFFPPNFLFDLFEVEFGKTPSTGIGKLHITFVDSDASQSPPEVLLDVLRDYAVLDVPAFREWSLREQKLFFLRSMLDSYNNSKELYGWDSTQANNVFAQLEKTSIEFKRFWGSSVVEKFSKRQARFYVDYCRDLKLYIAVIDSASGTTRLTHLSTLPPTLGALRQLLGNKRWIEPNVVRVYLSNAVDYWELNIATGSVKFNHSRALRGDAHGQYDLAKMYLEGRIVIKDQNAGIWWLEKAAQQNYKRAVSLLSRLTE